MIKFKNNNGFTVAELLVVMAVFLLILSVSLVNFKRGERVSQLRLASEHVSSDIRKAQTKSLTGSVERQITAPGGFGIYFSVEEPDSYVIFRDDGSNTYEPEQDNIIEIITLPFGVAISDLTESNLSVVFAPPKPTIYLNGDVALGQAIIDLESEFVSGKIGRVNLNRITGRITSELMDQ